MLFFSAMVSQQFQGGLLKKTLLEVTEDNKVTYWTLIVFSDVSIEVNKSNMVEKTTSGLIEFSDGGI